MKRLVSALIVLSLCLPATLLAVGSKNASYIGGTVAGLKEKTEGKIDTTLETEMVFTSKKQPELRIPYASIRELEYGQKAGRRVAVAVLISPFALFSKKRNHYFTVTYADAC